MLLLETKKNVKLFLWAASVYARVFPEALNSENIWAHCTNLPAFTDFLFSHLCCVPIVAKRPYCLRHVHPSAFISAAATRLIYAKLDFGTYERLSRNYRVC